MLTGEWRLGRGLCKLWLVVDYLVCTASVFNIVLISFDRFICVTRAVRAGRGCQRGREGLQPFQAGGFASGTGISAPLSLSRTAHETGAIEAAPLSPGNSSGSDWLCQKMHFLLTFTVVEVLCFKTGTSCVSEGTRCTNFLPSYTLNEL